MSPAAPRTPRELTAAAERYTLRSVHPRRAQPDGTWQAQAWRCYRTVPEVRFAARWIGGAMGAARLYAGRRVDEDTVEPAPQDHPASQVVAEIAGGPDGRADMLSKFGPHLVVPGEGWIVVMPGPEGGLAWHVLSVSEIRRQSTRLIAQVDGMEVAIPLGEEDEGPHAAPAVAIRVWEPDPEHHLEADSPVRSSLALLEELEMLHAAVAAIARSRLTGRGVLVVPKGARFPTAPGQAGQAEDDLIEVFLDVASTAIREPDSAAAAVPIILEVPPEAIDRIQHLTFESDFDQLAIELRNEVIRRYAAGSDLPAPIILGTTTEINHWGLWQMSEEALRLAVEPRLRLVAHALTTQWLRPVLKAQGVTDAEEWLVWWDTASLRVRANRSQTALEVYDRGALSDAALRRETGFEESDAPTPAQTPARGTPPTRTDPLPVEETNAMPDSLPASAGAVPEGLVAAADMLIYSALCGAGRKLLRTPKFPRRQRSQVAGAPAEQVHTLLPIQREEVTAWQLLTGAWSRVPEIAARYGADPSCLQAALETYCRELITAGLAHEYDNTARAVRECVGAPAPQGGAGG